MPGLKPIIPANHPLIKSYKKFKKIKIISERTMIPMGILVPVFRDYTGYDIHFDRTLYTPKTMVPFGRIFAPGLFQQ